MDRNTVQAVTIAVIGILAVSLAAATLTSTVATQSGEGRGAGGPGEGGLLPVPEQDQTIRLPLPPFFLELVLVVFVLMTLVAVGFLLDRWRQTLKVLAVLIVLMAIGFLLLPFLPSPEGGPPAMSAPPAANGSPLGGEGGARETDTIQPLPPAVTVLLILGLGLVGTALLFARSRTGSTGGSDDADPDDATTDTRAVGRAAGRAADRIEEAEPGADVDNEVYRAWRDMTDLLDVDDPETTTPGEFADAAVDAGMQPADVRELTRLFEDVRYGGRTASAEYERRAVETFRRIEDAYAVDADDAGEGA